MSDLVERLRTAQAGHGGYVWDLCGDAADEIERLRASLAKLMEAAQLTLLFHASDPWGDTKRLNWLRITGAEEATTKVMCDHIRAVLAEIEEKP